MPLPESKHKITSQLKGRILIIDGAMGTMIQGLGLGEEDFRGAELVVVNPAVRPGSRRQEDQTMNKERRFSRRPFLAVSIPAALLALAGIGVVLFLVPKRSSTLAVLNSRWYVACCLTTGIYLPHFPHNKPSPLNTPMTPKRYRQSLTLHR